MVAAACSVMTLSVQQTLEIPSPASYGDLQRTGLMAVFDNQSGARRGLVQICETRIDPDRPGPRGRRAGRALHRLRDVPVSRP